MNAQRVARLCEARNRLWADREERLDELARGACLSPFHFIREYEALFGVTPHQARIAARLDRAKRLLASGEMNVTEVCMELGMSSMGSFSTWFARETGESPREYQKRSRILVAGGFDLFPGCFGLMARFAIFEKYRGGGGFRIAV